MMPKLRFKNNRTLGINLITLVFVIACSLFIGRYTISPASLYKALVNIWHGEKLKGVMNTDWRVFYYIRLPRIILVMTVGAALSATQSVFHNPLVSPNLLG